MKHSLRYFFYLFVWMFYCCAGSSAPKYENRHHGIIVASKKFTESVILGELAAQFFRYHDIPVETRAELGGTRVLWSALLAGEIDIYPEYTGTLMQEIFADQEIHSSKRLREVMAVRGIGMTQALGFNNTYVIGMPGSLAEKLDVRSISDLRRYSGLRFGFSNEFLDRADGWRGLKHHYQLPQRNVRGLDHDLAYRGVENGSLDVTDLYATDAEILYYNLQPLADDRHYFPAYDAVFIYRSGLVKRYPLALQALERLPGSINVNQMRALNAAVKIDHLPMATVVANFIKTNYGISIATITDTAFERFVRNTLDHLFLVGISLSAAIACAIPLGVIAARYREAGQIILAVAGMVQTIPSLALLVLLIPMLGIGGPPAVVALFLYSLLPIIRNTHSGLRDIPTPILESAEALGLSSNARLRLVELPLATRSILAGIKTSAVINVGTATIAALIGAGGYGQPILTGIRLDDIGLILQGAVPAAVLALLVQGIFEVAERYLLPRSLSYY